MRILRPDLAQWALLLPFLVGAWVLYRSCRFHRSRTARDVGALGSALVMAGALVAALLRPQVLLTTRQPRYVRQDVIVMLDRSASMKAHDISPSRLARAIAELREFVRHKPDGVDRVALVGFADSSVVLSYLTDDTDSLLFYFDWLEQDQTPLLGTNIGAALTSAMQVAKKDDRDARKLFLLMSDGEDYGTELRRAVTSARAAGYHVNTIGIGSERAVPVPIREPDGRETPLRDDEGRPVLTKFSETTLRAIAADTGGVYLHSTNPGELRRALEQIAARDRTVAGWRTTTEYRDVYRIALAVASIAGAALWVLL